MPKNAEEAFKSFCESHGIDVDETYGSLYLSIKEAFMIGWEEGKEEGYESGYNNGYDSHYYKTNDSSH